MSGRKPCRGCGKRIHFSPCRHCGEAAPHERSVVSKLAIGVVAFCSVMALAFSTVIFSSTSSRALVNYEAGQSCISQLTGQHREFNKAIKRQLRNPTSFKHIETRTSQGASQNYDISATHITAVSHRIEVTFRAENGFGNVIAQTASGTYEPETCSAQVLSVY